MKKKKKPSHKKGKQIINERQEEVDEELLALQAIFGDDLRVLDDTQEGFSLKVVPHPGEAEVNYVSLVMHVTFPRLYPEEELHLRLTDAQGLKDSDVKAISKSLHNAAYSYSVSAQVCCFQLVQLCQDLLQTLNEPPQPEEAAPSSLWHDMQQRELATIEPSTSGTFTNNNINDPWTTAAGDSFDWLGANASSFSHPGGGGGAGGGKRPPRVPPPLATTKPSPFSGVTSSPETSIEKPKPTATDKAAAVDMPLATTGVSTTTSLSLPDQSASLGQSFSTVLRTIGAIGTALLPRSLQAYLKKGPQNGDDSDTADGFDVDVDEVTGLEEPEPASSSSGTGVKEKEREAGKESNGDGTTTNDEEREQLKKEMLMGHLIRRAAGEDRALNTVTTMLQRKGLVPQWLVWTLTQQPALFDRAYKRVFAKELAESSRDILSLAPFWKPGKPPPPPATSTAAATLGGLIHGSPSGGGGSTVASSRYKADFSEERVLGRGGYGLVLLATNRIDGRQYAIKKIPLSAATPHSYARIMREVTTLSRLHHPNVVRYYNSWVEEEDIPSRTNKSHKTTTGTAIRSRGTGGGGVAAGTSTTGYLYDDDSSMLEDTDDIGTSEDLTPSIYPSAKTRINILNPLQEHSSDEEDDDDDDRRQREQQNVNTSEESDDGIDSNESKAGSGTDTDTEVSDTDDNDNDSDGDDTETHTTVTAVVGGREDSVGLDFSKELRATTGGGGDGGNTRQKYSSSDYYNDDNEEEDTTSDGFTFDRSRPPPPTASKSANTRNGSGRGGGLEEDTWEEDGDTETTETTNRTGATPTGSKGVKFSGGGGGSSKQHQHQQLKGGPSLQPPKRRQMLYIQMEFCPRTLRDVLDSGGPTEPARWSATRQLLAGLQHIHAQGIIHRDLKPANLFYDAKGDIKLGDFGLAKFNVPNGSDLDGDLPPPASLSTTEMEPNYSDTTGVCGTSFYIDPWVEKAPSSELRYDERVDMFSLGIIVFELWRSFSTAMERAVVLRDLREKGEIPADFEKANPTVTRLIRWLMAPPEDRPTASEVLRSELLPPTVGDEELQDLLRSLPDNPVVHDKVLDQLFVLGGAAAASAAAPLTRSTMHYSATTLPRTAGAPVADAHPAEVRQRVFETLRDTFSRQGAVRMSSHDVGFPTSFGAEGSVDDGTVVDVLSRTGVRLALRGELRRPFAAWVVAQAASGNLPLTEGLRRWEVAQVHHKSRGSSALPRPLMLADLDIIAPAPAAGGSTRPLAEAEALSGVVKAIEALPELRDRWEVRLGHRALADAAMAHAGVPRELRPAALQLVTAVASSCPRHSSARAGRWPAIRQGLEGLGVSKDTIDRCKRFVFQGAGEALGALHWLESTFSGTPPGSNAINDIKALLPLLATWGVPGSRVTVDPFLSPQGGQYEGLLLQVHLVNEATGASATIAVGGRYDGLLKAYWARQAALTGVEGPPPALCAVGMTVSMDRIVAEVAAVDSGGVQKPKWRLSASDVLVCSRGGGGLLLERMALLRTLREAGIAAETMLIEAPSMQQQFGFASGRNIPWLVVISKASFSANDTVRVKSMHSRIEEDIPVSELTRFFQNSLQPHSMSGRATPALRSTDVEESAAEEEEEEQGGHKGRRGGRGKQR